MTDLRTVHDVWLNHFEASSFNPALSAKQRQLRQALQDEDPAKAWAVIQSMREICAQMNDPRQLAETLLSAGRAAFELGDYQQAKALLEESADQYNGDRHARAVAKWMLGYVLWNIPGQHEHATVAWQNGLSDFDWLYRRPFPPDGGWYQERVAEMKQALAETIDLDGLPPRLQPHVNVAGRPAAHGPRSGAQPPPPAQDPGGNPDDAAPEGEPAPPQPESGGSETKPPAATADRNGTPPPARPPGRSPGIQPGYLQGFMIGDPVALDPAFRAVGVDPHTDEEMLIEQVTIQEKTFGVFNPYRSGSALRLSSHDLVVVPVYGDSMNLAGIEDGDYALVRYQNNAHDGDIVVAEIDNEDTKGTLKRFKRVGKGLVQLISESTQDYPVREFAREDEGFTIRGKVMAIFKKQ